ncbi:hypothetical protein BDE02_01G328900 [Populus trichocarpa]|nr:hypothetical protein BDE02_01G328900 [Populus trichocarpa]
MANNKQKSLIICSRVKQHIQERSLRASNRKNTASRRRVSLNLTGGSCLVKDVSDVADSVSPFTERLLADDCSAEEDSTGELDGDLIFFNSPALSSVLETFTACTVGVTPSSCVAIENPSASTDGVSNSSDVRVPHIDPIAGAKDCSDCLLMAILVWSVW